MMHVWEEHRLIEEAAKDEHEVQSFVVERYRQQLSQDLSRQRFLSILRDYRQRGNKVRRRQADGLVAVVVGVEAMLS
jgi:hypothetical protein